jgi:hypothetical protein
LPTLGPKASLKLLLTRLFSVNHYYVLEKSLTGRIDAHKIRLPIVVKQADDADMEQAAKYIPQLNLESKMDLISRLLFYRTGIKQCYFATAGAGEAAYLQWLIYPTENDTIQKHFRGIFSPLRDGQILVENVFTFPKFRGHGLMVHITAELLKIAQSAGYKSAMMYIRKDRIESLNQNMMLEFKITSMLREYKFLGTTRRATVRSKRSRRKVIR